MIYIYIQYIHKLYTNNIHLDCAVKEGLLGYNPGYSELIGPQRANLVTSRYDVWATCMGSSLCLCRHESGDGNDGVSRMGSQVSVQARRYRRLQNRLQ